MTNANPYKASRDPSIVKVPRCRYLAIEGTGAPESSAFQQAVAALYAFAFTIKMSRKKAGGPVFKVAKLEALWWTDADGKGWSAKSRSKWHWQLLIPVPDLVAKKDLAAARASLSARENPAALADVTLIDIAEGDCAQVMHVGPYADEPKTIAEMDRFVESEGLQYRGRHHEIYLGDPRRTAPERLRTILRHPVRPAPSP